MKRFLINAAAFMTMAAMVSCGNEPEAPSQGSKTGFALSFFKNVNAIVEKGENVVVSPYSAGVALSMLAEGAEGETRVEFDNALIGCIFKAEDLGNNDTITVKSSNSVWVDNNFSIRNSYTNLLEKDFDAFIDALSFADPATVKAINDWCAENTNGKIDEIIDPCHQKGIYGDLEEGKLSAEEFRQIVLSESRPGAQAEDVDRAMWHILVGIEPYKIDLLKRLAESCDLYMLSNNNAICLPRSRQLFAEASAPLEEVFRKCYFSFEMQALKPSEAFYKAVMEDIGADPEDMLFIDDSLKNVEGSIQAGLPAVYYEPGTDLEELLIKVLEERD